MLQSFPIEALSTSRRQRYKLRPRSLSKLRDRSRLRLRRSSHSRSRSQSRRLRLKWQDVKWGLVPRYSSEMNICWKYSILTIMGIVTVLHFLTTYCVHTILKSHIFGNVCFLSPKVGRPDTVCDYLLISPLITAAVSIFWIQLFYICGRGGYTFRNHFINEQPWRIVLPSVVCFAAIVITQCLYIFVLHKHTTLYCNDVEAEFPEHRGKSCEFLIGTTSKTPVVWHYRTLYYSAITTCLLWLTATTIMVVRVLRAPDFKVVIDKQSKVKVPLDVKSNNNNKNALDRSVRFKRMSI